MRFCEVCGECAVWASQKEDFVRMQTERRHCHEVLVATLAMAASSIADARALSTLGRQLSLGIVAVPADTTTRDNIRRTWLRAKAF